MLRSFAVKWLSGKIGALIDFRGLLKHKKSMQKFSDQAWQLFIHVTMSLAEIYIVAPHPEWLFDQSNLYLIDVSPLIRGFLAVQMVRFFVRVLDFRMPCFDLSQGIWVITCFCHRFVEELHKDYFVTYAVCALDLSYRCASLFLSPSATAPLGDNDADHRCLVFQVPHDGCSGAARA